MPDIVGHLRPPRLTAAPSSPALGEEYYNTSTNILYYWNGSVWVQTGGASGAAGGDLTGSYPNPTVVGVGKAVSSLPGSPVDGQECFYLADSTNGVVWHLKYRAASASTHKWEFVGGSEMIGGPSGNLSTGSTTPVALTGGPSITVPLSGDYEVEHGGYAASNISAAAYNASVSALRNGSQAGTQAFFAFAASALNLGANVAISNAIANVSAGDVFTIGVSVSASSAAFANGWIKLKPRRVG